MIQGDTAMGEARRQDRLWRLVGMLRRTGPMRLGDAAAALSVSTMTLRRDLSQPRHGLALLGGHVLLQGGPPGESPYALEREQDSHAAAKRLAGHHAASLVEDGDTLFIDCGTTTPHLVEALAPDLALTVFCYALNIANLLSHRPRTQLLLLGGLFHPASASFASDEVLAGLRRSRIDKAFVSAGGVEAAFGASCAHAHEVPVKQAAIASARRAILVVDDSKLGACKPAGFAPLAAFERIVTNPPREAAAADALRRAGARLDLAGD
ncbi:MAG: DeoR family transcriptional regulator [Azospirillum brasilense]|nr:DeoR family transcriptional regulator [Roseomonas gilardii]PZR14613.1 MAG: DeoR family transcriptional regulator [Azospirillum brasilense]